MAGGAASWALDRKALDRVQYAWQDNGMTAAQPHVFIDTDYVEEPPRPGREGLWGQIFENCKALWRPAFGPACRQGQALCFLFYGRGE